MKVWIWRFTRHFVIGCPEATNQYRIAVIVVLSLTAEFINQRDHETKDINQNKGMPRHQLYRLACQRPFDVRDKLVKIQNMLGAFFNEKMSRSGPRSKSSRNR